MRADIQLHLLRSARFRGRSYNGTPSANAGWYADSNCSDHTTKDEANLSEKDIIRKESGLIIANGSLISIDHTSNSSVSCQNRNLLLKCFLHAPTVNKNLLSIRKLCKDNWVKIEFDDNVVCIKDRTTDKMILTEGIKDGLYHVDLKNLPMENSVIVEYVSLWHNHLGHINHQTILDMIKDFNLPVRN